MLSSVGITCRYREYWPPGGPNSKLRKRKGSIREMTGLGRRTSGEKKKKKKLKKTRVKRTQTIRHRNARWNREAIDLGVATTYSGKGVGLLHAAGSRRSREIAPCGRFARPGRWSSSTPRALVGRPTSGLSSVPYSGPGCSVFGGHRGFCCGG